MESHILIIHTDFAFRRALCNTLEQLGYPVLNTPHGHDAIRLSRNNTCSVAVIGDCGGEIEEVVDGITAASPRTWCLVLGVPGIDSGSVRYLSGSDTNPEALLDTIRAAYEAYESEESLRESDAKYKTLFSAVPDAVCIADARSHALMDANEAFFTLYGLRSRDLRRTRYESISAAPEAETRELFGDGNRTGIETISTHRRSDGRTFPVSITCREFELASAQLCCIVIRDISRQFATENELNTVNRSVRGLIEGIGDGFIAISADMGIIYCNRAAVTQFGTPGLDPAGKPLFSVFPDLLDTALVSWIREIQAEPRPLSFEQYFENARGRTWYDIRLYPYDEKISIFFRNITARKDLELHLNQTQRVEAVGRLAGGIAHDFNNLLTVIVGYSDLIQNTPEMPPEVTESIEEIRKSAERATALTHQLLAFSRKQVLQPQLIRPDELLRSFEKMFRRLIGEDIELVMHLDDAERSVEVDPIQFEQVVLNLIINARDAMPAGGTLEIRTSQIDIETADTEVDNALKAGSYVAVSIRDTGCGMDNHTLQHVFEPFFTTKSRDQGTGLGLATAYGIVRQSGGYIFGESEIGKGTVFDVYLPVAEPSSHPEEEIEDEPEITEGHGTILVVEDDDSLRSIATRVLRNLGYTVFDAGNGNEAIEIAENAGASRLDLIITDVVLPGRSGREVVEYVRARYRDIKILFISGYADDEMLKRGVAADSEAFLPKPFSTDMLKRAVHTLLTG